MTLCSTVNAQSNKAVHVSHISSLTLSDADFSALEERTPPTIKPLPNYRSIKASLTYLANLSEAIDKAMIAFDQRNSKSDFPTFTNLNTDQPASASVQKANSRGVPLYPIWLTKILVSYTFSPNAKALTKLPYELKGNWGVSSPSGG
jgi:hypothetical protein